MHIPKEINTGHTSGDVSNQLENDEKEFEEKIAKTIELVMETLCINGITDEVGVNALINIVLKILMHHKCPENNIKQISYATRKALRQMRVKKSA